MDYEAAGRLRDVIEQTTTNEEIISRTLIPGLELVGLRYVIAFRQARDFSDPDSDYLVELPTGCGNTCCCWAAVPIMGYHQSQRVVRL